MITWDTAGGGGIQVATANRRDGWVRGTMPVSFLEADAVPLADRMRPGVTGTLNRVFSPIKTLMVIFICHYVCRAYANGFHGEKAVKSR